MPRKMLLLALSTILVASSALAAAQETHSGTVVAIDRGRHALTLEEMGPWAGPGTGTVEQTITLMPDTKVDLVRRSSGSTLGGWPGGSVESTLAPGQIHAGDFATVQVVRRGGRLVAVSIDVMTPSAD